jgi:1,4-dihydroxy-6-naphthoate synthase
MSAIAATSTGARNTAPYLAHAPVFICFTHALTHATSIEMTTIHLAHSPDSDDAFMFYALASGKIDTDGINYVHELQDIESLNQRARRGELEVTAVSIHAYAYIADQYALLTHGSSMGDGYGPRLVAKHPMTRAEVKGKRIATPGPLTTAYLALKLYEPDFIAVDTPFDQIEDRVIAGDVDAGLLIHEGQLTYADNGLSLVADMGEWWLQETGLPLPLGGNVVRRDLGDDLTKKISRHLRASIAYGLDHRAAALDHSMQYARGLDRGKADEFVGMYVNDWTLDYGDRGRLAVHALLDRGVKAGIITREVDVQFVDD